MSADFRCKGGAVAGVGSTFRYAADGEGNVGIHESFRNDPVSGLYGDFSVGAHRCVHKKIYRADDEKAFSRRSVDVVKAVRAPVPF